MMAPTRFTAWEEERHFIVLFLVWSPLTPHWMGRWKLMLSDRPLTVLQKRRRCDGGEKRGGRSGHPTTLCGLQ